MTTAPQTCLITGGASGIGEATARLFARRGSRVMICDVQSEKGAEIAKELGEMTVFFHLDVREEKHFENAIQEVQARWGRLDCVVNNAAIGGVLGPIDEIPADEFDTVGQVVLRSVFLGTKHAARTMRQQRTGSIVNVASIAGLVSGFGPHVYSTCKAAVVHFSRSVALELAECGVRVNSVCPGNIETPIHTHIRDDSWKQRVRKISDVLVKDQAMDRMGRPEEIAEAIFWLASDAASFVTGHALVVDGGLLAGRPWRSQPTGWREYHASRISQ